MTAAEIRVLEYFAIGVRKRTAELRAKKLERARRSNPPLWERDRFGILYERRHSPPWSPAGGGFRVMRKPISGS